MPKYLIQAVYTADGASGAARTRTVVLLTPKEIDHATKELVTYRAPGQAGRRS